MRVLSYPYFKKGTCSGSRAWGVTVGWVWASSWGDENVLEPQSDDGGQTVSARNAAQQGTRKR